MTTLATSSQRSMNSERSRRDSVLRVIKKRVPFKTKAA